jgi:hypothetical protein
MTRDDPELGPVRLCKGCDEWWPFDAEFWHLRDGALNPAWLPRCIACCAEYSAERRRLRQTIARTNLVLPSPVEGRCNAVMYGRDRCGRHQGHAYGHRSFATMAAETARKHAA